jgi:hypothetical protein
VTIEKGPYLEDFQFEKIRELEEKRRKTVLNSIKNSKPNAIMSYCPVEIGRDNFMVVNPREEQDTVMFFKVYLRK